MGKLSEVNMVDKELVLYNSKRLLPRKKILIS